jgi:hypothetical protein
MLPRNWFLNMSCGAVPVFDPLVRPPLLSTSTTEPLTTTSRPLADIAAAVAALAAAAVALLDELVA